jgi:hypothetical protein
LLRQGVERGDGIGLLWCDGTHEPYQKSLWRLWRGVRAWTAATSRQMQDKQTQAYSIP